VAVEIDEEEGWLVYYYSILVSSVPFLDCRALLAMTEYLLMLFLLNSNLSFVNLTYHFCFQLVIPAEAGIFGSWVWSLLHEIPAFAGMTIRP
jgi:hypothetical protein